MRRDSRPIQGHLATVHMPIFQDESEETRSELRCTYASYQVVSMGVAERRTLSSDTEWSVSFSSAGTKDGSQTIIGLLVRTRARLILLGIEVPFMWSG